MNEEQKRILEDIHKKTENLMVEKANLTLVARKSILEGNYPDNVILEQIRKIDEAIARIYRDKIENIRKNSKKIKDDAIKKYGNPIITDDKKKEYYSTGPNRIIFKTSELSKAKIRIDSAQFELYEQLFREINNIEEEQRILWVHTHGGKQSKTDLEKILRANINDMQSIMPTLQENLKIENELANMDLEEKKEKLSELQQDIQERQSRHGSQRNRILYSEKKEANKTNREINELNNEIINNEAILVDSEKSQHEIEIEASERKKEIQKQHQKEQNVKSIARPKNKMSLKEKLKRVAVAAVAAVTAFTAGIGLFNGKKAEKSNDIPTVTPTTQTEEYNNTNLVQKKVAPEKKDNKVTINYEAQTPTSTPENKQTVSQDIYVEENTQEKAKLWDTVKIGNNIYENMYDAVHHNNSKQSYFSNQPDKEYTILAVSYSNGVETKYVNTAMSDNNEIENYLRENGYEPQGYMISSKKTGIDFTNAKNYLGNITGYVPVDEVIQEIQQQKGMGK